MDLLKKFCASRVSFYNSDFPISLTHRSNHTVTLPELCKHSTPPYQPSLILFNGHLQTLWTALSRNEIVVRYKRRIFKSEDDLYPGSFAVDFVSQDDNDIKQEDSSLPPQTTYYRDHDAPTGSLDCAPMLVALHGVAGGSHEPYVKHVLAPLVASGWKACVVVSRGCGGSQLTSPLLYNARSTWDLKQTVTFLRRRFPNRPLYAIGFSIGANILVNVSSPESTCISGMLIERDKCSTLARRVRIVVSEPLWSARTLGTWRSLTTHSGGAGWASTSTHMPWLTERSRSCNGEKESWLLRVYPISNAQHSHADMVLRNRSIAATAVEKIRYFFDFDMYAYNHIDHHVAITELTFKSAVQLPMWGYPTKGTYYRDASSVDAVLAVRVPLFALNAEDDPVRLTVRLHYTCH